MSGNPFVRPYASSQEISPGCSFEGLMLKLNEAPIVWPPDTTHWI